MIRIAFFLVVAFVAGLTVFLAQGQAPAEQPAALPVPEKVSTDALDEPAVVTLQKPEAAPEPEPAAAPVIDAPNHSPMIVELYGLINGERATPLVENPVLSARAYERAEFLCEQSQWSHDGWEASFVGFTGYMGENLASGFSDAQAAHQALMSSPTHRANIVHPGYTAIGMGEACGIIVELFN